MTLAVAVENGNPAENILVIAPNYRWFREWCRDHDINPRSHNVRHISSSRDIRGYAGGWYVDLGSNAIDAAELYARLNMMKHAFGLKNALV